MNKKIMRRLVSLIVGLAALSAGCATTNQDNSSRLDLIKNRKELICGVSGKIPGFSFLKSDGTYQGLDVDICKAFAAAIIGDSEKIQYRPLTAAERFTAIKTGEIDLLSRNGFGINCGRLTNNFPIQNKGLARKK